MNVVALAVVPVFGTVALGYALARAGLFDSDSGRGLTRFMYYLAIPAMLFRSLLEAELPQRIPWDYLCAFYLPSFFLFAIGMLCARHFLGWQRHETAMAGMSAGYSNMVLLGFPLTLAAFGPEAAVPMFLLLATQSTFLFPLMTYTLEMTAPERAGGARAQLGTIIKLIINPVILSMMLGVSANLLGFGLPLVVDRSLELLSAAGPACALIALGISLADYKIGGSYRDVSLLIGLKNFVHPLLVWIACDALDIETTWKHVAVVLAAMPCGLNAFIFATQYDIRKETVSKCIVVSTALSSIVATLLLAWFHR